MEMLKTYFDSLQAMLLATLRETSRNEDALLIENFKGNKNNLLYWREGGGISFSIFQSSIAAMVVQGESGVGLLNLPVTDAGFLYYILCVPLRQKGITDPQGQIYIVSTDVEDMLYIGSQGFDSKLWLFCTIDGIRENYDVFATFIDRSTLDKMLNGHSLSCRIISSGRAAIGAMRLFNYYEKIPFMSNTLICGLDLLD